MINFVSESVRDLWERDDRHPVRAAINAGFAALGHRHPLSPAAVRMERKRTTNLTEQSEQSAVTVWFGEGPALESNGAREAAVRTAVKLGLSVLLAAGLGAATAVAARLEQRPKVIDAPRKRIS